MPVTGVYFVPSNPNSPTALSTLIEQLRASYHPTPSGRWGLDHKLLRDTPSCLPPSAYASPPNTAPRSMQLLSLSHFPSHGFMYTSDYPKSDPWDGASGGGAAQATHTTNGSAKETPFTPSSDPQQQEQQQHGQREGLTSPSGRTMMTLDPQSFASFLSVTLRACEPLWCHRLTLSVPSGVAFSVSDFHIRLGDVRQTQPANRIRGTVVEIEYRGPSGSEANMATTSTKPAEEDEDDDDILRPPPSQTASSTSTSARRQKHHLLTDEDWETGTALIREFWSRIAVPGAREAILVPGVGTEAREARKQGKARLTTTGAGDDNDGIAGVDLARQYFELFRLNR